MSRISFLDIPIDNLSMEETSEIAEKYIRERRHILHTVVNSAKIVAMQKNEELNRSVRNADIINADGQAVVWASRLFKEPLKERVAGIDLMQKLVAMAHKNNFKIFLLGAREEVVQKVADIYCKKYSSEIIAGYLNGFFHPEEEEKIAIQIAQSKSDILFVAMPSPKKEIFLYRYSQILSNIPFIMGVGGSFDVISGLVKRAPVWMQKSGLEWLFRVYQEPRRMWKRYLITNTLFIILVLKHYFSAILQKKKVGQ